MKRAAAAVAWTGLATPDHWSGGRREVDFFDVKGVVEQLCGWLMVTPQVGADRRAVSRRRPRRRDSSSSRRGSASSASSIPRWPNGATLPAGDAVYVLELDLDALSALRAVTGRASRSRCRVIPQSCATFRSSSTTPCLPRPFVARFERQAPPTLVDVREFDRYQGKGIPDGKVSLSLRLTFQAPDRTLDRCRGSRGDGRYRRGAVHELGAVQR